MKKNFTDEQIEQLSEQQYGTACEITEIITATDDIDVFDIVYTAICDNSYIDGSGCNPTGTIEEIETEMGVEFPVDIVEEIRWIIICDNEKCEAIVSEEE